MEESALRALDLIAKKRDGGALTTAQWNWLVSAYGRGDVAEEQMSALLMATWFRGMSAAETLALTLAMRDSGDILRLPGLGRPLVDKHSTGGVGDKVTLVLAPMVAALGLAMAKLSGRGLGHTGGTLDKLEAISGYRVDLSPDQLVAQVRAVGVAVAAASQQLAPADRRLYALRDATGTVNQAGLIAASIMSKKLAVETDALVLDVKVGEGAFFATQLDGEAFAEAALAIGAGAGRQVRAVLTKMASPLGREVGNGREVAEAIDVLSGHGPKEVATIAAVLAANLLEMVMPDASAETAAAKAWQTLANGSAMEHFERWISAQGGAISGLPARLRQAAAAEGVIRADRTGTLAAISALAIGQAAALAGAGRSRKEDQVDPRAGITLVAEVGQAMVPGDVLALIHASDQTRLGQAQRLGARAFRLADGTGAETPLMLAVMRHADAHRKRRRSRGSDGGDGGTDL